MGTLQLHNSNIVTNEHSPAETYQVRLTLDILDSTHKHDSRTYKCGHCGKTFLDNSEFHRHSAMSHGDKIPDLVKDQEVTLTCLDYKILECTKLQ